MAVYQWPALCVYTYNAQSLQPRQSQGDGYWHTQLLKVSVEQSDDDAVFVDNPLRQLTASEDHLCDAFPHDETSDQVQN